MSEYRYIYAPQAEENLKDIDNYLSYNLHAPQAAYNFLLELQKKLKELCKMPTMYRLCTYPSLAESGIHFMMVNQYKIYYEIDENNRLINIVFIRHSSQNEEK